MDRRPGRPGGNRKRRYTGRNPVHPGGCLGSVAMARRKLTEYERKRSFAKTPEPRGGKKSKRAKGNRFVVHEHHARRLHWDLRLEHDGVLASWALPKGVPQDPKENRLAVRTEDHPLEYLEFQGKI